MAISKSEEKEFVGRFHEYTKTLDCVHCGLCIQDCPTYEVTGRESDSPRGRIYLMRGYAEKTIPLSRESLRHLDQCIVCRACETVCPSGIRMGEMMESFRHELNNALPKKGWRHYAARFLLREVVPYRHKIALLTDLLYVYQRLGIRSVVRKIGELCVPQLVDLDALLPPIPPPSVRRIATDATIPGGLYEATGKSRMRVALFLGCITSEWFAPMHRATIRVLNRAGCDVLVPEAQTCCGALHRHGGFLDDSDGLYAKNAEVFSKLDADVLVVNAAGCGAALKEPPHSMPDGLGIPVRDVCELLDSIGIAPPDQEFRKKVAYDQPCHLVHGQQVQANAVTELLSQVPGLDLVPLADSERCCGSGGVYNLIHPEMAKPVLANKVRAILDSGAEVVVTGNPGCWLQIRSGLLEQNIEVMHPVDLLDRAYRNGSE